MKQFFKFVFASCLGVFLAGMALFVFFLSAALSTSKEELKEVRSNTVIEVNLENSIPELTDNVADRSPFKHDKHVGLQDLKDALERAANDSKIKGVFIHSKYVQAGPATVTVLRSALNDFKKSGKFIVAYADYYSQGGYYVSSVADKVIVNPNGHVELKGIAAEIPFFKDMLDRLGVKMQVYYAGQFKSATESFRYNQMSPQNRAQTHEYIDGVYDVVLNDLAVSRNIPKSELVNISDGGLSQFAGDAVKYKLADAVGYYDEALSELRKRLHLNENEKVSSISLSDYAQSYTKSRGSAKDKIAVIYAEGTIEMGDEGSGSEQDGVIEGNRYAKMIRKIRQDKDIKAIVLRINSGGGSSMASDIIWRELMLAKQAGKGIIVSMGDYAASGGYYIATPADSIFAEKNTLTGSIGVFSVIPGFQKMLKDKLGVSFDTVKTSRYATGVSTVFDLNDQEGRMMQAGTDTIYETFLRRVGESRHKTRDEVHAIGQGHIWLGSKGKELGLVDEIGGLNDAIRAAAKKANLTDYRITEYPKLQDPLQKLIAQFTGQNAGDKVKQDAIKTELGAFYPYYKELKAIEAMRGPQMRAPFIQLGN